MQEYLQMGKNSIVQYLHLSVGWIQALCHVLYGSKNKTHEGRQFPQTPSPPQNIEKHHYCVTFTVDVLWILAKF